jgi:hypothetical protein
MYTCAVGAERKDLNQLRIWVTTLLELGGAQETDLFIHILSGEHGQEVIDFVSERDIAFASIPSFGDGRCCNKIVQLRTPELRQRRYVVLCEADLAFCGPIDRWVGLGRAAAKPVDHANPPLELLEELYRRAGFRHFPEQARCSHSNGSTYANNCNRGLYILSTDLIADLSPRWEKWALWTLEQESLLGPYLTHADQISFGLAMWDIGEPVRALPAAANFPTHLPLEQYDTDCDTPSVLHYHDRVALNGLLLPLGFPRVDDQIRLVNGKLSGTSTTESDS